MRRFLLLFFSTAAWVNAQVPLPVKAEMVLLHGKIITVDAKDSIAEAVAIAQGRIIAVGRDADISAYITKSTTIVDLHGRAATPGLIDTHCHFRETSQLFELNLGDESIHTIDDIVQKVGTRVAASPPGQWVVGTGWDEGKLAEGRYVTAADLDKVSPNNPVWLEHTTGHYGVANSIALRIGEIGPNTGNPTAGLIDRDKQGRATGVLKEGPAMTLVMHHIPPYTVDQKRQGIQAMIADFNREGMTAVKNPEIEPGEWDLYRELLTQGKLTVRILALWPGGRTLATAKKTIETLATLPKPPSSLGDGQLLAGGVKLYMDGSGGARTAWMHQEWNKRSTETDTGNFGYPNIDPPVYREMVKLIHNAGYHISTHAIGDRAIDWVVDSYAEALREHPVKGLRHGIIHCNLPTDHAMDVMARLQKQFDAGYPEPQAEFIWWLGDNYAGNLGPARAPHLIPLRTFQSRGILWTGGSDYSVTPFPARYGIWASMTRTTLNGTYGPQPFGTAEDVDVHTALRSFTSWAARQIFLEDRIGSIEVGKDADIAVWDRDLYSIPADDVRNMKCELTLLRGKVVYKVADANASSR